MTTTTVLDRFRLDGKVAIVTGASSGLGIAFAEALAEAGADLVLAARRSDRLKQTRALVEERGRRALTVTVDVARPEDAQAAVDAAMTEFGHVDVLVNNAGMSPIYDTLVNVTEALYDKVLDVNMKGHFRLTSLPRLTQAGAEASAAVLAEPIGSSRAGGPGPARSGAATGASG